MKEIFIIIGTYILSREMFRASAQRLSNFDFKKNLPLRFKIVLRIFGYKRKFENKELWGINFYPSPEHFSKQQKREILMPFIGFILICIGTLL